MLIIVVTNFAIRSSIYSYYLNKRKGLPKRKGLLLSLDKHLNKPDHEQI